MVGPGAGRVRPDAAAGGLFVAGRYGTMRFNRIAASGINYDGVQTNTVTRWDHAAHRLQLGTGYRLARNLEIRGEYAWNWNASSADGTGDLFSVQLWWQY